MLPRANQDADFIKDFSYAQNTHHLAISSSAGIALLKLASRYFGPTPDEAKIEALYQHCCAELKKFAASLPEDNKTSYNRQQALTLSDFIIKKSAESPNEHDVVSLYIPDETTGEFGKVSYTFPPKEVLTLTLLAIYDESAYADHYEQAVGEEKAKQAATHLADRATSFFTAVSNIKQNICHHGVRNELMMCLNKCHCDIDLIEDFSGTALNFSREFLLLPVNVTTYTSKALLEWIAYGDPKKLLGQNGLKATLTAALNAHFQEHGIDPKDITIYDQQTLSDFFDTVSFNCGPKTFPTLAAIQEIFSYPVDENSQETRHQALLHIQQFTKQSDFLNNVEAANIITHFARLYKLSDQIRKNKAIIALSSEGESLQAAYQAIFEPTTGQTFFQSVLESPGNVRRVNDHLQIRDAENQLEKIKSAELADFITNFFAKWNAHDSEYYISRSYVYTQLLDLYRTEEGKKKILLSDEQLTSLLKKAEAGKEIDRSEEKTETMVTYITPYEINRIFLHAILEPRWTETFSDVFGAALKLANGINSSNKLGTDLKESSYTPEVLSQLAYLQSVNQSNVGEKTLARPGSMILLPNRAQQVIDWVNIFSLTQDRPDLQRYILNQNYRKIIPIILNANDFNSFFYIFAQIEERESFLNYFITLSPHLQQIFTSNFIHDPVPGSFNFFRQLSIDAQLKLAHAISKRILSSPYIENFLRMLPEDRRAEFIESSIEHINRFSLETILKSLPGEKKLPIAVSALKKIIADPSMTPNIEAYCIEEILADLTTEDKIAFIKQYPISNMPCLIAALNAFPKSFRIALLYDKQLPLLALINEGAALIEILFIIPEYQRLGCVRMHQGLVNTDSDLDAILNILPSTDIPSLFYTLMERGNLSKIANGLTELVEKYTLNPKEIRHMISLLKTRLKQNGPDEEDQKYTHQVLDNLKTYRAWLKKNKPQKASINQQSIFKAQPSHRQYHAKEPVAESSSPAFKK